jgi:uncharacterized membrane protein YfcA
MINSIIRPFKVAATIFYGIVISFFKATVEIVWGMVTFMLLISLLNYYKADPSAIQNLFPLIEFIKTNWLYFWFAFFSGELYLNIKEIYSK